MARHLLSAAAANPACALWSPDTLCQVAWTVAELFEDQADQRWRKLQ